MVHGLCFARSDQQLKKRNMRTFNAGVWMDHTQARIMDPALDPPLVRVVRSLTEGQVREPGQGPNGIRLGFGRSSNDEYGQHHVFMDEQRKYFRSLANALTGYETIYIFGPSPVHSRFANYLRRDRRFKYSNIAVDRGGHFNDREIAEEEGGFFFP